SSSAAAIPASPRIAEYRAGTLVAANWASAAANAVVPTTAPPNTRLSMWVWRAASDGYSDRSTPSTDHDAIAPSAENQKSARISAGTAGLAIRIGPRVRAVCGSRSASTPTPTTRQITATTAYGVRSGCGAYWASSADPRIATVMPMLKLTPLS